MLQETSVSTKKLASLGTPVSLSCWHFCIGNDAEGRCQMRWFEAGVVSGKRKPDGVDFLSDGDLFPLAPETVTVWL